MAAIGAHSEVGVDIWGYTGPQGQLVFSAVTLCTRLTLSRSVLGSLRFLLAYATGEKEWPFPEITFLRYAAYDILLAAANAGDLAASKAIAKISPAPGGGLWYVRPALEQLDSINVTA